MSTDVLIWTHKPFYKNEAWVVKLDRGSPVGIAEVMGLMFGGKVENLFPIINDQDNALLYRMAPVEVIRLN